MVKVKNEGTNGSSPRIAFILVSKGATIGPFTRKQGKPNKEYSHMRKVVTMGSRTKEKQIYFQAHKASGTAAELIMNLDR